LGVTTDRSPIGLARIGLLHTGRAIQMSGVKYTTTVYADDAIIVALARATLRECVVVDVCLPPMLLVHITMRDVHGLQCGVVVLVSVGGSRCPQSSPRCR